MESQTPAVPSEKKDLTFESIHGLLDLFHTQDGVAFAISSHNGKSEILPIRSRKFFQLVMKYVYEMTGKVPSSFAITSMVNLLEIKALDAREDEVFIRLGTVDGATCIDLGNEAGEKVEITSTHVAIVPSAHSKAKFLSTPRSRAQVRPKLDGQLINLLKFLNLEDQEHAILIIAWLVMALNTDGPYPILNIQGQQGSGKSSLCKLLRDLIDPASPSLESFPRTEQDLLISASNGHLLAYDNLSSVSNNMSDILCRISTGGGQSKRQLYSDKEEARFDVKKPVVVNGITDLFTRQDVCDRAIIVKTAVIPPERRLPEDELRQLWEKEKPGILGGLYNAVSMALRNKDAVKLNSYPRMADFVKFIVAAESALPWQPGAFQRAYENNRMGIIEDAIESDPIATAVQQLMLHYPAGWSSTPSYLLATLNQCTSEDIRRLRIWPRLPNHLSAKLNRCATFLRARGINITFGKDAGQRFISITQLTQPQPVQSSPSASLPI